MALTDLAQRLREPAPFWMLDRGTGTPAELYGLGLVHKSRADEVGVLDLVEMEKRCYGLLDLSALPEDVGLQLLLDGLAIWSGGAPGGWEKVPSDGRSTAKMLDALFGGGRSADVFFGDNEETPDDPAHGPLRARLRSQGWGPRWVMEDPWFLRLFVAGRPDVVRAPLFWVRAPADRVPRRVVERVVAIAHRLHRALEPATEAPELFVVDDPELPQGLGRALPGVVVATVPRATLGEEGGNAKLAGQLHQLSRLKHARDRALPDSEIKDERGRQWVSPSPIRGLMYGYAPWCSDEPAEVQGLRAGHRAPLVVLPDEL